MSSIRTFGSITLMVVAIGCGGQAVTESGGSVAESQLTEAMEAVNRFWSAAVTNDLPGMRQESTGGKAIEWADRWRQAYPTFFNETANSLEAVAGYTPPDQPEAIELLIEVSWVSCPPPAHEGNRDRYHVRLLPSNSEWRIADIWKDIC